MGNSRKPPDDEKPHRRYQYAIRVYVDTEQRREIERKANMLGLSASSYLLMAGLERPDRVVR